MRLGPDSGNRFRVLFLGAHCDDIEIGCGASILQLRRDNPDAEIRWVVFSGCETRQSETLASASRFLGPDSEHAVTFADFRESYFPSELTGIKERLEQVKMDVQPDLVFTHFRHDRHQDHRVISDLTWNTWRSEQILEYEIPKYDGDLGQPNVYMPLSREVSEAKIEILMDSYRSQHSKAWFTADTFAGLMRLRGIESGRAEPMAEAFYGRKLALDFSV